MIGKLGIAISLAACASASLSQRAPPPSFASRTAPQLSWADALTCGKRGYYTDVSGTEAARTFVEGSSRIDNMLTTGGDPAAAMETALRVARVVEAVRAEMRMKEIGAVLLSAAHQCLAEHGYTRFRLTKEQRERMSRLRIGSAERHFYLHSLASDPIVLERQRMLAPQVRVEAQEPAQ